MAPTSPFDTFVAARLETSASSRHATALLVGCHASSLAAVANGLAGTSVVHDSCIAKPGASPHVLELVVRRTPLRATIAVACFPPPSDEDAALAAALRLRQHLLASRAADVIVFVGGARGSSEAEGMLMRAVGRAVGEGVWAHAVVVDVGSGEEGEEAEGMRREAVRQAVGERWRGVVHVVWRGDSGGSMGGAAEAVGSAMACVVRSSGGAFFPQPLPRHSNDHPPAATQFDDLALLADHNIATSASRASHSPSASSLPPASLNSPLPTPAADPSTPATPASRPTLVLPAAAALIAPPPPPLPLPAFASLSLALSASALSAPLLLPPTRLPSALPLSAPAPRPCPLGPLTAVAAAPPAASFQSRCLAPMPLMPACHVAAANGLAAEVSRAGVGGKNQTTAFPDLMHLPGHAGHASDPPSAAGAQRTVVVWMRNDLRVHDHEALAVANTEAAAVLPLYCFDPRDYGKSASGFDRTGAYRARFLLQSVADMRQALRARGSDLVVRVGRPEDVVLAVARAVGAAAVLFHGEATAEESRVERHVVARLKEEGMEAQSYWGSTLFHVDDLPFTLDHMPSNYSAFRDAVKGIKVREVQDPPEQLKVLPARGSIQPGDIPSLQALGLSSTQPPVQGGEAEALRRLSGFVAHAKAAAADPNAAASSSSQYGASFSCKISPWLAMGCLSPRRIFHQALQLEGSLARKLTNRPAVSSRSSESTTSIQAAATAPSLDWLVFELLWRDFFRFITKKHSMEALPISAVPA